jgi:hypothetical protein
MIRRYPRPVLRRATQSVAPGFRASPFAAALYWRVTRDSHSSRIQRNSLKRFTGAPVYPGQFSCASRRLRAVKIPLRGLPTARIIGTFARLCVITCGRARATAVNLHPCTAWTLVNAGPIFCYSRQAMARTFGEIGGSKRPCNPKAIFAAKRQTLAEPRGIGNPWSFLGRSALAATHSLPNSENASSSALLKPKRISYLHFSNSEPVRAREWMGGAFVIPSSRISRVQLPAPSPHNHPFGSFRASE